MSVKIGNIGLGEFPRPRTMEDVSDPPFRYVCKYSGADMMYTEFISSEGLIKDAAKSRKLDIFEIPTSDRHTDIAVNLHHMREATEIATVVNPVLRLRLPGKMWMPAVPVPVCCRMWIKNLAMTKAVVQATHLPRLRQDWVGMIIPKMFMK